MKRRRNADDKLRKLERAAASGEPSAVVAYWRACLKAGIMPEPNYISQEYYYVVWAPDLENYNNYGLKQGEKAPYLVLYTGDPYSSSDLYVVNTGVIRTQYFEEQGMEALARVLDLWDTRDTKTNPRSCRGDALLRKLEREANAAPEDIQLRVRLWREQLRRGITPKPTEISEQDDFQEERHWWILPCVSGVLNTVIGFSPNLGYLNYISPFSNVPAWSAESVDNTILQNTITKMLDAWEKYKQLQAKYSGRHGGGIYIRDDDEA